MHEFSALELDPLQSRNADSSVRPQLPMARLGFEAELASQEHGLRYLGPSIRGLFGLVLKELVCIVPHRDCSRCRLRAACPFTRIFDGVPVRKDVAFSTLDSAPQPFVLGVAPPGAWYGTPEQLQWSVTLFGEAARWAPFMIEAFLRSGERGIGPRRVPFRLIRVSDVLSGETVFDHASEFIRQPCQVNAVSGVRPQDGVVRWHFRTPLHLRHHGRVQRRPTPLDLIIAGRRRFTAMVALHGSGVPLAGVCFEPSAFQCVAEELRDWHLWRHSSRQLQRMDLPGILGWMDVEGPWSQVGEWIEAINCTHMGKHATFGYGSVSWEQRP